MNIITFKSEQAWNEAGASIIASLLQTNPRAVLGLATGGTPVGMYAELVKKYKAGWISFKEATTFNLDEYIGMEESHPESYRSYMNKHLFDHIDLPRERAHIPNSDPAQAAEESARYEAMVSEAGIDLQLLGLGHNGHIGFNEPADTLTSGTHLIELEEATREANARFFNDISEVPTQAITMGIGSILKAKQILLMVKGADKADIVKEALQGPITTQCPASFLQLHPNVVVLLDEAAGSKLSE